LVGRGDHVYLADFGLSRRLADQVAGFDAGLSLGTPAYVAPEQIEGREVDARADQYSLGCVLYECLSGEPPFPRSSEAAVLFAHLEEAPPSFPGLEGVLSHALAKDPPDRYSSCAGLIDAAAEALGVTVRRRNLWPLVAAALGVAVLAASLAGFLLTRGGGAPASAPMGRLVRIDPSGGGVETVAAVGGRPTSVTVGGGRVWVTTQGDTGIWRIDAGTGAADRFAATGAPAGVALHGSVAYVLSSSAGHTGAAGTVTRIDAETGAVIDQVATDGGSAIVGGSDGVWVAGPSAVDHVADVSTYTGKVLARSPLPFLGRLDEEHVRFDVTAIATGENGVWVTGDALDPELWRIGPRSMRVDSTATLPFAPSGVAAGYGGVWVVAQLGDVLVRVEPSTGRIVRSIPVGREPRAVAAGFGSIWVANAVDRTVSRIDPRAGHVVSTIRLPVAPTALAVGDSGVWAAGEAA
jgi:streptogramin lyase